MPPAQTVKTNLALLGLLLIGVNTPLNHTNYEAAIST